MTALFKSFVLCSLSMTVFILLLIFLMPLLSKRYKAKGLYYTWFVLILTLMVPLRLPLPLGSFSRIQGEVKILYLLQDKLNNQTSALLREVPVVTWWQLAAFIWLAGIVIILSCHLYKHLKFKGMLKRWSEPADKKLYILTEGLKADMGIKEKVTLLLNPCIQSPLLTGFIKPVIVLPQLDLKEKELEYVLTHELVHLKRKDLWFKALTLIALTLHWFNPVIYFIIKIIHNLCEESCDTEVMRDKDFQSRKNYCEAIIAVIGHGSDLRTAFSTNLYNSRHSLKYRIYSIMDQKKKKSGILICSLLFLHMLLLSSVFYGLPAIRNLAPGFLVTATAHSAVSVRIHTTKDYLYHTDLKADRNINSANTSIENYMTFTDPFDSGVAYTYTTSITTHSVENSIISSTTIDENPSPSE